MWRLQVKLLREGGANEPTAGPGAEQNGSGGENSDGPAGQTTAETLQLRGKEPLQLIDPRAPSLAAEVVTLERVCDIFVSISLHILVTCGP